MLPNLSFVSSLSGSGLIPTDAVVDDLHLIEHQLAVGTITANHNHTIQTRALEDVAETLYKIAVDLQHMCYTPRYGTQEMNAREVRLDGASHTDVTIKFIGKLKIWVKIVDWNTQNTDAELAVWYNFEPLESSKFKTLFYQDEMERSNLTQLSNPVHYKLYETFIKQMSTNFVSSSLLPSGKLKLGEELGKISKLDSLETFGGLLDRLIKRVVAVASGPSKP
jgi:hypothetical protein